MLYYKQTRPANPSHIKHTINGTATMNDPKGILQQSQLWETDIITDLA